MSANTNKIKGGGDLEGDAIPARCRHARYLPGFCLHAHTRRVEHGRRTGRVNTGKQRRRSALVKSRPTHSPVIASTPCASSFAYRQTRLSATALRGPALRRQSSHLDSFTRRGALRPPTLHPAARIYRHSCVRADRHGGREGRDVLRSADRAIFTTPPGLLSLAHRQLEPLNV